MALDVIAGFMYLVREFLGYLLGHISEIPFSISLGAAILLTILYFASFVSHTLIKILLVPAWIFAVVTYFFPALIPEAYEFISLIIFAAMNGVTLLIISVRRTRLRNTHLEKALSEVVEWMKADQLLNPNIKLTDQEITYEIEKIMRKNSVS